MTTFIKTKFKISDDQTNIDKYRLAANINLAMNHYYKLLWSSESFEVNFNVGFGIPIEFPSQRKKLVKLVHKQKIVLLWSSESFGVKYNIWFGIPRQFPNQRKKLLKSVHNQEIGLLWSSSYLRRSTISFLESPSNFKIKEKKKYTNRSINKEIILLWSRESFMESTISDLESPSNFQVREKKLFKSVHKQVNRTFVVQ